MYKKRLGDAVKEERLRRDLSQNTLAEESGVSLRTISDIETYKANPRLDSLYSPASYLNISVDEVIYGHKENEDTTMKQIITELNTCSEKELQIALHTLQGLLNGLRSKPE